MTENSPPSTEEKKNIKHSTLFLEWQATLPDLKLPKEKVKSALEFMKSSLSESPSPRFRDFWDAKTLCLTFFKLPLAPYEREPLWAEFVSLSEEVRRLKKLLDEESAFAVEQIELAIQALEKAMESTNVSSEEYVAKSCVALLKNREQYNELQRECSHLNVVASRILALRKELMKTDMRIKTKNQLFERLSSLGDKVFPRKKELSVQISDLFIQDVEAFVKQNFNKEMTPGELLFPLRDAVKELQKIAKVLSLNSKAFEKAREHLSGCWETLKQWDEKRKEKIQELRAEDKKKVEELINKIAAFAQENRTLQEVNSFSDEILGEMVAMKLRREEAKEVREKLFSATAPVVERERLKDEESRKKREEILRIKKEGLEEIKRDLADLLQKGASMSVQALEERRGEIQERRSKLSLLKRDEMQLDPLLRKVEDLLREKREELELGGEGNVKELYALYEERLSQRREIQALLESYRKELGGSGFAFEFAMQLQDLIAVEKQRLQKANAAIDEIENKIADIE